MIRCIIFFNSLLFCSDSIAQYLKSRTLILLAESRHDSELIQQGKILKADTSGISERDIMIRVVTPSTDKDRYARWRNNKNGFLFILIGKDGGDKFTSEDPVCLQQLYSLIDAMPMRKEEMKTQKEKN